MLKLAWIPHGLCPSICVVAVQLRCGNGRCGLSVNRIIALLTDQCGKEDLMCVCILEPNEVFVEGWLASMSASLIVMLCVRLCAIFNLCVCVWALRQFLEETENV